MDKNYRLLNSDPPDVIAFLGPIMKGTQSKLCLDNPGRDSVYFKVLTTDPLAFCVKPKMGKVDPGESLDICITLRNDDIKYYLEKQPKFKILTVEHSDGDTDPKVVWDEEKVKDKDNQSYLRFSCSFIAFDSRSHLITEKEENQPMVNMNHVRSISYDTTGSNLSVSKEEPSTSTRPMKPNFLKRYSAQIIIGVFSVVMAYVAATSLIPERL